jgi:hypothetical protein
MRNAKGELTTKKARVQVVIFNAMTKFNFNRRSHDKLLVVDGHFPDKAVAITGGRNISLDYYGILEDGSEDPTAFRDLEIMLKPGEREKDHDLTIGDVSELYYTLLFLYEGNRRIRPNKGKRILPSKGHYMGNNSSRGDLYKAQRNKSQQQLAFLKSLPEINNRMNNMPHYMSEGFHDAKVRLAHQLSNLTATKVTTQVEENLLANPNSINYLIARVADKRKKDEDISGTLRLVSPYLFIGKYYDEEKNVTHDGAENLRGFLRDHPNARVEIVTNSVMTSDNFFAQAIIDMDMAPRILLSPELEKAWVSGLEEGELNPEVVESEVWKKLVNHPQIFIYQTGKLDSVLLGGDNYYGKLHAKFIVGEITGFIGTSNFDYRSMLYNNEMGFFYRDEGLRDDLIDIFEELKATSYRWGSPEWLEMRKQLMNSDSKKAGPARRQRILFKTMRGLGVEYLI